MSYAPTRVYFAPDGDGSILGSFKHTKTNCKFEFSQNTTTDPWGSDYPHLVWVGPDHYDADYRYARVLKTVAYVVCEEDEAGNPVEQRWPIKAHTKYEGASE